MNLVQMLLTLVRGDFVVISGREVVYTEKALAFLWYFDINVILATEVILCMTYITHRKL